MTILDREYFCLSDELRADFEERAGAEASLFLGGDYVNSFEFCEWGSGLGRLSVELRLGIGKYLPQYRYYVRFWAVDEDVERQISRTRSTLLPFDTNLADLVIALSAIHATAREHLEVPGELETCLDIFETLDLAGINKLKE